MSNENEHVGSNHEPNPDQPGPVNNGWIPRDNGSTADLPWRPPQGNEPEEYPTPGANQEPLPVEYGSLQDDVARAVSRIVAEQLSVTRQWSAPMPEPHVLKEYDDVVPGAGGRILAAFEAVTVDASKRDDRIVEAEIESKKSGLAVAGLLLAVCVVAAILFFAFGNNTAGSTLLGAPVLIGLVSIITGAFKRS